MPKTPKPQVKKVTLNLRRNSDAKKLAKLVADGWTVLSEHKRSMREWKPGQVDYVLTKTA